MKYSTAFRYLGVLGGIAFLLAVGILRYGSVANVVAVCLGHHVVLEQPDIDLGDTDAEVEEFEVSVANLTSTEIELVGFKDC